MLGAGADRARRWRSRRSSGCAGARRDRLAQARARPCVGADMRAARARRRLVARARAWGGGELPEVVFEATGAQEPMRASLDVGRAGGPGRGRRPLDARGAAAHRGLALPRARSARHSCCDAADFAEAVELVAGARRRGGAADSHGFALDEAPAAIASRSTYPAEVMKALVHAGWHRSGQIGRLFDVRGRRAVVTGAASGLGLAISRGAGRLRRAGHARRSSTPSGSSEVGGALRGPWLRCSHRSRRRDRRRLGACRLRRRRRRPTAASTSSSRTRASRPSRATRTPAGRSSTRWRTTSGDGSSASTSTASCTPCAPPRR